MSIDVSVESPHGWKVHSRVVTGLISIHYYSLNVYVYVGATSQIFFGVYGKWEGGVYDSPFFGAYLLDKSDLAGTTGFGTIIVIGS